SFTLGNGAQVVLVENHRLPLVSVRVINQRGGGREDPRGQAGLAGLCADLLDVVALDPLADTFEPSVELLADVVLRPRFAAADVTRVRTDRLELVRRRPDEPRRLAALAF